MVKAIVRSTVAFAVGLTLWGGQSSAAPQACPPHAGRTIDIFLGPEGNKKGCTIVDVKPGTLIAFRGDVINWVFHNGCDKPRAMKIGDRRPKRPKAGPPDLEDEDFVANHPGRHIKASPYPIPARHQGTVCAVVRDATYRLYKYDIAGDEGEDPEIEIQPPPPPPPAPNRRQQ